MLHIALYQNSDAACSSVAFGGVSKPNENVDPITSYTNTKTPLDQVRATPPAPEFEHMPSESPMETSATCTVTHEETTLASRRAEATAAVHLGKGNARRLAKGPRCTPHTGFNLLAAAEKQDRKKELAREQRKRSRLKTRLFKAGISYNRIQDIMEKKIMGDGLQHLLSSLPKQLAESVKSWCADNSNDTTTSYTNITAPLDQGQGTVGCPTKGPDCTPPPEVEQTTVETAMETSHANVTAPHDQGQGTAVCPTKGSDCTPPPQVEQTTAETAIETSYANVTAPHGQGQGTARCPTKGPDCTPPPQVDETTGKAAKTSHVNTTAPLDQRRGTVECLPKGPECTPTPEFEQTTGGTAIGTDGLSTVAHGDNETSPANGELQCHSMPIDTIPTSTVAPRETMLATDRPETAATLYLGIVNAECPAKDPQCTHPPGFGLPSEAEKQRKRDLSRERAQKSRLKASLVKANFPEDRIQEVLEKTIVGDDLQHLISSLPGQLSGRVERMVLRCGRQTSATWL